MKIISVQKLLSQKPSYNGNKKVSPNYQTATKPIHNPTKEALTTTGAWFAFGVGLDFISRKLTFFKSPIKNSLAINGIISTAAGIFTAYKLSQKN